MIAQPLIDYLEQLQAKGETHVSLDPKARSIMREFYLRATQSQWSTPSAPKKRSSAVKSSTPPVSKATPSMLVEGDSLAKKFTTLREMNLNNRSLQALGTLRSKLVFPASPQQSDIVFIGESPSYHDEKSGIPFSGPIGEKLNGILRAMKLDRSSVHITNILKFRPSLPNQTTSTRPASADELAAAKPLIDQEIRALKPKIIITLGEATAQFFTGQETYLDTIRNSSYQYLSTPLITTYHPSFLLHSQETQDKRSLWEDMLKVMSIMGHPIDEKQQSYFLPKT